MKRVYDNLSPGGKFAFTTDVKDPSEEPREVYNLMDKLLGPGIFQEILSSKLRFLSVEEYSQLATDSGFPEISTETETRMHEWKTVDDVIDTAHGWLQGAIDPSTLDKNIVQELKAKYEGNSGPALQMTRTYLYVILTK